jgi:hypothetical protein
MPRIFPHQQNPSTDKWQGLPAEIPRFASPFDQAWLEWFWPFLLVFEALPYSYFFSLFLWGYI